MPDVAHLLAVPLDDPSLEIPLCPTGTWRGELVRIKYRDKDADGDPLTDKNGDEYVMVNLLCRPEQPEEDVDKRQADAWIKAGGPAETIISMAKFIRGKRSTGQVGKLLQLLGVPVTGRSLKDVADQYKGGVAVYFEVSHIERDGEDRENIEEIGPIEVD